MIKKERFFSIGYCTNHKLAYLLVTAKNLQTPGMLRRSGAAVFSFKRPAWRHQQESDSTPEEPAPKRRRGPNPAKTGIVYLCLMAALHFSCKYGLGILKNSFRAWPHCNSLFCLQVRARHFLLQFTPQNTILSSQNSEAALSLPT